MSGLKTVLYAMAGVGLVVLATAMLSIAFTDRDHPLQVAVSGEAEAEADSSFLQTVRLQDAREGYVIAELYQEFDPAPVSRSAWTHTYPDGVGTCTAEIVLATQQGINDAPPTATPHPTPTHGVLPTPTYAAYPWGNTFPPIAALPPYPPDSTGGSRDPNPTLGYPTPRPTRTPTNSPLNTPEPTPLPTATLQPLLAAVDWVGWQNRALAIETAGLASLGTPEGTQVRSYLEILTGVSLSSQRLLMRSPARNAVWYDGRAHIRLQQASGRIVLPSARTDIDAHYRSAVLHVKAYPLDRCDRIDMRWEQAAAVVVKTLTGQPFADWGDPSLHPQNPDNALVGLSYDKSENLLTFTTAGGTTTVICDLDNDCPPPPPQTVYIAWGPDATFVEGDFTMYAHNTSPVEVDITVPQSTDEFAAVAVPTDQYLTRFVTWNESTQQVVWGDWCSYGMDCSRLVTTYPITINNASYKYYVSKDGPSQYAINALISRSADKAAVYFED